MTYIIPISECGVTGSGLQTGQRFCGGSKVASGDADVLCDVARGAEELVCVLVLRGSCEKKERRRRDGVVEIIFLVPQRYLSKVPLVSCVNTTTVVLRVGNIVWLSGSVLDMKRQAVVSSWMASWANANI